MKTNKSKIMFLAAAIVLLAASITIATTPKYTFGGTTEETTVQDTQTDLEWQTGETVTIETWVLALAYCDTLEYGGYNNWRLPNVTELSSLVDTKKTAPPAINTHFFSSTNFNSGAYWTSTTSPTSTSTAYVVWFMDTADEYALGGVEISAKSANRNVVCVRGF